MRETGDLRIVLRELTDGEVLAGAPAGRIILSKMLMAIPQRLDRPTRVFVDFAGIQLATVSFLREGPFAFRNIARHEHPFLYPIMANATELVREEIAELTELRRGVIILCNLAESGTVTDIEILGNLDLKQQITFDLVRKLGEAGAPELMRDYGSSEGITHPTAWNNRLTALNSLGLLMEFNQGRSKRYRPVLEE